MFLLVVSLFSGIFPMCVLLFSVVYIEFVHDLLMFYMFS